MAERGRSRDVKRLPGQVANITGLGGAQMRRLRPAQKTGENVHASKACCAWPCGRNGGTRRSHSAQAANGNFVPLFTYRTGPFSGSGIPVANGLHDYLTMLNERDGGIGGEKLIIQECEDGYDTQKGVQCYDSVKDRNPVVITPYSTGITEQLIPKAAVDKIPVLSMAYGLSASADGSLFPWIFNPPDTYWDGASAFIRHVAKVDGGFDKLKGKTIGLIYLDAPYGKEPIPLLQSLAKDYGYTLKLYPG